jgi:hypothetical protein
LSLGLSTHLMIVDFLNGQAVGSLKMGSLPWRLSFLFDTEKSGIYINTRWWSGSINFRTAKVLSFIPRPLAYRHSLPLSNRYCIFVLNACNKNQVKSSY